MFIRCLLGAKIIFTEKIFYIELFKFIYRTCLSAEQYPI